MTVSDACILLLTSWNNYWRNGDSNSDRYRSSNNQPQLMPEASCILFLWFGWGFEVARSCTTWWETMFGCVVTTWDESVCNKCHRLCRTFLFIAFLLDLSLFAVLKKERPRTIRTPLIATTKNNSVNHFTVTRLILSFVWNSICHIWFLWRMTPNQTFSCGPSLIMWATCGTIISIRLHRSGLESG